MDGLDESVCSPLAVCGNCFRDRDLARRSGGGGGGTFLSCEARTDALDEATTASDKAPSSSPEELSSKLVVLLLSDVVYSDAVPGVDGRLRDPWLVSKSRR